MPEKRAQDETENNRLPAAATGNASNPSGGEATVPEGNNQILGAKAEQYLRESASIEDMPDDIDWQEADATLRQEGEADGDKP